MVGLALRTVALALRGVLCAGGWLCWAVGESGGGVECEARGATVVRSAAWRPQAGVRSSTVRLAAPRPPE